MIMDCYLFFTGYLAFLYVNWYLQEEVSLLNVFVEKEKTTSVDFQIGIRNFELFVSKKSELVFYEFHSLLNSFEIFGESLSFFALLKKLETLDKDLGSHLTQNKIVGLPGMKIKILVNFLFDLNFIRNNKVTRSDSLIS